ncbi:MAG TPA: hypothetical protein DHN33_06070 [Eubacteriaceae bacterium]|nr:hypothetical protein [Eubacteriaceae bacterium]
MKKMFVTALNCMDGRVQEPLIDWAKQYLQASYVDMITEPGVDRFFCRKDQLEPGTIFEKITISTEQHGSDSVIVAGHHDCAGHPVSDEQHRQDVHHSIQNLKERFPDIRWIGLFIDSNWEVELLVDTSDQDAL